MCFVWKGLWESGLEGRGPYQVRINTVSSPTGTMEDEWRRKMGVSGWLLGGKMSERREIEIELEVL